jgi:hypothetical protein
MSDIITINTKEFKDSATDEIICSTSTYISRLVNGVLYINALRQDQDGNDIEVPVMEQPWKCNPDGSRSHWADDKDAESWLESIKHDMLS